MNAQDSIGIRITKRDFFNLPEDMRKMDQIPMVLTMVNGVEDFVAAIIID